MTLLIKFDCLVSYTYYTRNLKSENTSLEKTFVWSHSSVVFTENQKGKNSAYQKDKEEIFLAREAAKFLKEAKAYSTSRSGLPPLQRRPPAPAARRSPRRNGPLPVVTSQRPNMTSWHAQPISSRSRERLIRDSAESAARGGAILSEKETLQGYAPARLQSAHRSLLALLPKVRSRDSNGGVHGTSSGAAGRPSGGGTAGVGRGAANPDDPTALQPCRPRPRRQLPTHEVRRPERMRLQGPSGGAHATPRGAAGRRCGARA